MQGAKGVTIGGANMWALLLDKEPGNSAAAGDLAVDVLDRKLKKAAPVVVQVAKPAKRSNTVKKEKKIAAAVDDKRAANVHGREVQINGAGVSKPTAAAAAIMPHVEKLTSTGGEEIKETLSVLPSKEEAEEEEVKEEVVLEVVAARGGRRHTVAAPAQTRKAAAPIAVITGTNMWALLSDDDPGHGGAMSAKRRNKTKTKKKKSAAGGSEDATSTVGNKEETPASELDEEMSEDEEEMTGEAATVGSQCRAAASLMFWAALSVATLILYFPADA